MPRGWTHALGALLTVTLACACGDDDAPGSQADSDGGASTAAGKGGAGGKGGSSGKGGAGGKGGSGGKGGADAGSDPIGGDGGGDDPTSDSPGDYSSYWKRKTSELTILDPTRPTEFVQETLKLPLKMTDPVDHREVDIYIRFEGDERHVYAFFTGDGVYYRTKGMASKLEDKYFINDEAGTHIFELRDGHLVETAITSSGMVSVTSEATHHKLAGDFPPPGWPSEMVEAP